MPSGDFYAFDFAQSDLRQARLGRVERTGVNDELIFPLNPNKVTRSKGPRYAILPVALADYGPQASTTPPFEWIGNSFEEIHIEFLLLPRGNIEGRPKKEIGR